MFPNLLAKWKFHPELYTSTPYVCVLVEISLVAYAYIQFRKQYASHNTHTEILLSCGKTYFVITAIVFPFLKLNDAAFDLSNGPVLDEVPKNSAFSNWIHARGFSATKHAYNAHFFAET